MPPITPYTTHAPTATSSAVLMSPRPKTMAMDQGRVCFVFEGGLVEQSKGEQVEFEGDDAATPATPRSRRGTREV